MRPFQSPNCPILSPARGSGPYLLQCSFAPRQHGRRTLSCFCKYNKYHFGIQILYTTNDDRHPKGRTGVSQIIGGRRPTQGVWGIRPPVSRRQQAQKEQRVTLLFLCLGRELRYWWLLCIHCWLFKVIVLNELTVLEEMRAGPQFCGLKIIVGSCGQNVVKNQ